MYQIEAPWRKISGRVEDGLTTLWTPQTTTWIHLHTWIANINRAGLSKCFKRHSLLPDAGQARDALSCYNLPEAAGPFCLALSLLFGTQSGGEDLPTTQIQNPRRGRLRTLLRRKKDSQEAQTAESAGPSRYRWYSGAYPSLEIRGDARTAS